MNYWAAAVTSQGLIPPTIRRGLLIPPLRHAPANVLPALRLVRRANQLGSWIAWRWGCSRYNVIMDRAGQHRRLAVALPFLAAALLAMALSNVATGSTGPASWLPHAVLSGSLVWALIAILQTGRLIGGDGTPHPGIAAIGAGLIGWAAIGLGAPSPACCSIAALLIGAGVMIGGVLLFADAERDGRHPAVPTGRSLLSLGSMLLGIAALNGMAVELAHDEGSHSAGHAVGLGLIGIACFVLAVSEGRLVLRMISRGFGQERRG